MHAVPARPSLITHSADFLRAALARGDWSECLPSERMLCARLRISRPTLRAVLVQLEKEGVIGSVENKKRRVLLQPFSRAQAPHSRVIALLTPVTLQAMPPFVLFWVDALRGLLADAGFHLEVQASPPCFGAKAKASLKKLTDRTQAAAWVLFRSTPAMQRWFVDQALPVVIAGSTAQDLKLPSIDLDYRAICHHAAVTLKQKGHKHIALLLPDSAHAGDTESALGFCQALTHAETTASVVYHKETPKHVVEKLDALLRRSAKPTAFLVARSIHTLTVITHLMRCGHQLPRDFAVVSRDDDAFLAHLVPKITRYRANAGQFAKRISQLVLELAQTGHTSTQPVRLIPELQQGETA
jgi:DNA-binding LacI/PurR family transcriptional regulator